MVDQNMVNAVWDTKKLNPSWGRGRIAEYLGVTEYAVRKVLENLYETPQGVLESNGLDPRDWKLTSIRGDENGVRGFLAKPAQNGLSLDTLVERTEALVSDLYLNMGIESRNDIERNREDVRGIREDMGDDLPNRPKKHMLLELGITDPHFGLNSLEDYRGTLDNIEELLDTGLYGECLIWFGSDNLHVNGHKMQTVNGTSQDEVDLEQAWEDSFLFFSSILFMCRKRGIKPKVVYIPGNHDKDLSWALCKTIAACNPDLEIDCEVEQYKVHTYGSVFVGMTHGDKGSVANMDRLFRGYFPE